MTILIRAPELQDIPAIVQLISELAATAGEMSPLNADYVNQYLNSPISRILLAEVDGEIVGLMSYSIRPDLYHAGDCGLIEELIVRDGKRNRGIGSAMLKDLFARLAGCKEISVGVMTENSEALKFYRRQGLDEDAVLLEKHF